MPQFQDDGLTLFDGEFGQATHGGAFGGRFIRGFFEPAQRFPLPGEAAPEGATVVQRAVAEGPHAVMPRLGRRGCQLHQGEKSFLKNVFCLAVAQAERAPVKNELGGLLVKEAAAPMFCVISVHGFN